jgi:hypothetical protein
MIYVNKVEYLNEILPALSTVTWLNCFVTFSKQHDFTSHFKIYKDYVSTFQRQLYFYLKCAIKINFKFMK